MDVEHTSLHGYISNTPLDTEDPTEHQLRAGRSTSPPGKKKNRTMQNSVGQRKELGWGAGGRRVSRSGSVPGAWGNRSRDQIPILGQLLGTEVKDLRLLDSEVADL